MPLKTPMPKPFLSSAEILKELGQIVKAARVQFYRFQQYSISKHLVGFVFMIYEKFKKKQSFEFKSIYWGIILGVPNYLTLYFFIQSLQAQLHQFLFELGC